MFLAEQELREKSANKSKFTYKIPLPEKVNLGLCFSFRNKLTSIYYRCKGKWIGGTLIKACVRFYNR